MQVLKLSHIIPRMRRTGAEREANEKAVVSLVALMGGPSVYRKQGLKLSDFHQILDADPNDDLSGLRLITERMDPTLQHRQTLPDEPLLPPTIAMDWLVRGQRVREREGIVLLDAKDHVSKAGFRIATGMDPLKLSEVYKVTSDNIMQIEPWAVGDIAKEVVADYKKRHPNP